MADQNRRTGLLGRLSNGFVAGFLATLIFHQLTVALLRGLRVTPFLPYSWVPTEPFGLPAVLSLSLWGGVWGIIFILVHGRFPAGAGYWATAFLFGAIFPSLVALLLVLPLKGRPMAGGGHLPLLVTAFLVNGAWGIGTGIFIRTLQHRCSGSRGAGN